ncbi:hypothetical protein QQX13_02585 [Demequina sp. SYSU T00068]|uniref:hypothetical protein n=1 Tax=Demequina lignilytica TaxID=3051663 RepID=UPI002622B2E7|nr:hypothetical protein [Demequina sp. SYSU T00068]MDN4489710.1 hypothetical protein [Demequina sp. SYSU T00068]
MEIYTGVIYPLVLIVAAVLAVTGIVTLLYPPAHRVLQWAVSATWGAVGVHLVAVVLLLLSGSSAGLVLTLGYLLASVALLPLLGIGRLGTPEAAAADPDPERPVLSPAQIARVDAASAAIVAIALAVLAWRVLIILETAA